MDTLSVKDFGAAGDGIADDADAFRAAERAASAGSQIRVPRGTYRIGSSIPVTKKVQWVGAGGVSRANTAVKLVWAGKDGGQMFVLAKGPAVVGIVFRGLAFADGGVAGPRCRYLVLEDVMSAVIGQNVFLTSRPGYPGIDVFGASYFNVIRDNHFEDTSVRVAFDANSTEIVFNHFFGNRRAPALPTAVVLSGGVNGVRVLSNVFEGYFGVAAIDVDKAIFGQVKENRIEAYTGTPMRVGLVHVMDLEPNALFRSNPGPLIEFSGTAFSRFVGNSFAAHPEGGQSLTARDVDLTLRDEKLATNELADFNFRNPLAARGVSFAYTKDLSRSDRPFLTITRPSRTDAGLTLGGLSVDSLPLRYLQDQGMWITFSVLADADPTNEGSPSIHVESDNPAQPIWYVPELSFIPKDGKKHWIKISRRVDPRDRYFRFVVDLAYSGPRRATDTARVYGAAVHLGTGALSAPLYSKWDAAPSLGTHTVGEYVRNDDPAESGPSGAKYLVTGWMCVASGTPGTWLAVRGATGN